MLKKLTIWCLLIFIMGCDREDNVPIDIGNRGVITALRNGVPWESTVMLADNRVFLEDSLILALTSNARLPLGDATEGISITSIHPIFNKQKIVRGDIECARNCPISAKFRINIASDVAGDGYEVDTTATNNFIQFTNYNSSRAEIEGIFNVSLILTKDSNNPGTPPEKLEFTNGKFTSKVQREWFE